MSANDFKMPTGLDPKAFRPSSSPKYMLCAGSVTLEHGIPDTPSEYAEEGSRQHRFAELVLRYWQEGTVLIDSPEWRNGLRQEYADLRTSLPQAQQESVNAYAKALVDSRRPGDALLFEERVAHGPAIGVPGASGTFDACILRADGKSFAVWDRKFPWGKPVYASGSAEDDQEDGETSNMEDFGTMRGHPPLMLYALGIIETYGGWMFDPAGLKQVDFVIYQESPGRENSVSRWSCTPEYLEAFRGMAANAVRMAQKAFSDYWVGLQSVGKDAIEAWLSWWTGEYLRPGKAQCKYCKAKPVCPALRNLALASVAGTEVALEGELQPQLEGWDLRLAGLDDGKLEQMYEALPLVEEWKKAVAWQMFDRMSNHGARMARHKLVQGREGNRRWSNPEAVAGTAEGLGLDCLFERKLVSPTQAAKLAKKGSVPELVWSKLEEHIERPPGRLTIAEVIDRREEIAVTPIEQTKIHDDFLIDD